MRIIEDLQRIIKPNIISNHGCEWKDWIGQPARCGDPIEATSLLRLTSSAELLLLQTMTFLLALPKALASATVRLANVVGGRQRPTSRPSEVSGFAAA
jgi:hypothetical protein